MPPLVTGDTDVATPSLSRRVSVLPRNATSVLSLNRDCARVAKVPPAVLTRRAAGRP